MLTLLNRLAGLVAMVLIAVVVVLLTPFAAFAADEGTGGTVASNSAFLDSASWMLLAGVLTPLITSFVQQGRWTGTTRTIIGVVASVIVGIVTLLANGTLEETFNDGTVTGLSLLALVVVTSAAAYKTIWVPVGVAPALERVTSPKSLRQ